MEKKYMYKLVVGIAILVMGLLFAAFYQYDTSISIFLISFGLILFVVTAFRLFRQGDLPDRDERTKKLAAYGITYSWLLTLVIITVLSLVEYFRLAELTARGVLGLLLFFMIISANIFRWYFMQKGDIE